MHLKFWFNFFQKEKTYFLLGSHPKLSHWEDDTVLQTNTKVQGNLLFTSQYTTKAYGTITDFI